MTHTAMMAIEQVREKDVANESVPVQESLEETEKLSLAPWRPADPPVAASVGNLVSFMQAVAHQFTMSVQAATKELVDRVESSTTPSSPASSIPRTKLKIVTAKANFVGKMLEALEEMETQRQWLVGEIRNLDGQWHGKVLNRIREAEVEVEREEYQIQHMIHSPNMELSMAMRAISALNEKKAYLKGLKFQLQETRR